MPAGCAEDQLDSAPEAGAAANTVAYEASEYGCRFVIPAGWSVAEEKRRQESLTLRLENSDQTGSLTVTVSAAGLHTADQLLAAAEEALRSGLYKLHEPVVHGNMTLESGESIPLLEATAGSNEKFEARTAALSGAGFNARVTLIARENYCAGCLPT